MISKPKRKPTKYWKNLADKLFSQRIRGLGYCQLKGLDDITCGGGLQCMHIVGRDNMRLRWDDKNALCGCAGHHVFYTHHPFYFFQLIEKEFPEVWKYVQTHQNELWDKDYQALLERLK